MSTASTDPSPQVPIEAEKQLREKLRLWQAEHPQATLTEIEIVIDDELNKLRRQLVEQALVEVKEEKQVDCPQCGIPMVSNGLRERQLQMKGGETARFKRTQQRCSKCGYTVFPPR